jgi:four helix bundle protein
MEPKVHRKYDLEERLINFALEISKIVDKMPNTRLGNYLAGQLIRCGNSPAFNYGEAQSADSTNDFIRKIKIILKELRETRIGLIITQKAKLLENLDLLNNTISENNQLIAIFVKSIETARKNQIKTKKKDE